MASNLPPSIVSKATASSGQSSPAQSQSGSVATGDNYPQRRSGGVSRASPTPRNNQQQRKQHKASKRLPRLGTEDALAESVSQQYPETDKLYSFNMLLVASLPDLSPSRPVEQV